MSWTRGQSTRFNQSPFIEQAQEESIHPTSSGYTQHHHQKNIQRNVQTPYSSQQKNVAATFTQEGLQTFSTIFSSSVEASIAKALPDVVERAVERKIQEVVRHAFQQVNQQISDHLSQVTQLVQNEIEKQVSEAIDKTSLNLRLQPQATQFETHQLPVAGTASEPSDLLSTGIVDTMTDTNAAMTGNEATTSPVAEPISRRVRKENPRTRVSTRSRIERELRTVITVLQDVGRPVSTRELRALAKNVEWGKNFTVKLNHLMHKANGSIERVGKGMYQYRA